VRKIIKEKRSVRESMRVHSLLFKKFISTFNLLDYWEGRFLATNLLATVRYRSNPPFFGQQFEFSLCAVYTYPMIVFK